ncbi:hypothetical protein AJ80_08590 [Polytolypa hystricis UAMH7299]|uniref:Mitochondrial import inner membrane translocase subunit TIM50 n=1 Tax=Polytolypa hystricis (strain UAMH7299) TaxID=1447883 RepID=A0A2B7X4L9_POLH7|nr:hypothetical protein AJ80_08590 [Polytolypa hystricis UAMH7299]
MLSRTALPLLRRRAIAVPIHASRLAGQPRFFAKANKPSPPGGRGPSSTPPSGPQSKLNQKPKAAEEQSSSPQEGREFSKEQPEFESTTESQNAPAQDQAESEPASPQKPLPDLTQGIPSTIAQELESRSKSRSSGLNLTEDPAFASEDGGDRGDMPEDAYTSSLERKRKRLVNWVYAVFLGVSVGGTMYSGRNWDTEEEEKAHPDAPSGWGFGLFFNRINARFSDLTSYYKDPAFEKLLPDEDPMLRQPYTLVLSMEDLLVHSEWSREHGWRVAKRPGVDYFLRYLNQYYELVIFTTVQSMMADQVLRKLDPYRIIRWPLFREATKYEDGDYVKDLSYLNRDLSKVILIDTNAAHAKRQPENAIILDKWKGDPKDKSLVSLIPFLEYMAGMGIDDVRPVLKSFDGTYIPAEFARREKAMREKFEKQLEEERSKKPKHSVSGIASLFGLQRPAPTLDGIDPTQGLEEGKMVWDQIRERGQKQYELIEKEIRENGELWLKEMAAEEEKAREEQMKGMKSSFTGFLGSPGASK